jgi:DNA-binding LacI/PurR family transcriptional regulator
MRANIDDVAKEAGVHRSTVSRALTGSGPVSPENRERVLAAARKLNYHPNTVAGALKSRRRNTWGLLSFWYFAPNSLDHYYAKILGGLLDSAGKVAHRVLLQNLVGRYDQSEDARRFCNDAQLSGVVIIAPRSADAGLQELERLGIPAVLVAYRPRAHLSFIDLDNIKASKILVEHLVARGHKRIAFIGGELKLNSNARDRHKGFLEGMKQHGLKADDRLVFNREFTPAFATLAFDQLLSLSPSARPTAVVCATDMMAIAVMEAARRAGLSIPSDLAVAGVDNSPEAATASPPLTTIHSPFYEMGARAGEILCKLHDDPRSGPAEVLLEPQLIVRESTGKL